MLWLKVAQVAGSGEEVSRESVSIPLDLEVLHGKPSDIYNTFSPLPSQNDGIKI